MKVGICGLGDRIGYLTKVFQRIIPSFEAVAYADPAPTGFRRWDEDAVRKIRGYPTLEQMLDGERLDLLMIGSPNVFHYDHLRTALEAGVKIFCEKPIVVSEEETFQLLRDIRKHGIDRIMVGLVLRHAPIYRDLTRLVDDGFLGSIMSIEASEHIRPAHGAFFFRDWRRLSNLTGGYLLEKCCHDIDLYAGLVRSRPARVASFGGTSFFREENQHLESKPVYRRWPTTWNDTKSSFSSDADIVDHQVAMIEYLSGVRLSFHTNIHTPDAFRRFCVIGTGGMAEGDFARGYLRAHEAESGECAFDKTYEHDGISIHYGADASMVTDIASHMNDGTSLPVSVVDALEAGLTAIKIDESRRLGEVLNLSDLWARFDETLSS